MSNYHGSNGHCQHNKQPIRTRIRGHNTDLELLSKQIGSALESLNRIHSKGLPIKGPLILSEFGSKSLLESFYVGNVFPGLRVADPFMGGGTPLLEANRAGCDLIGFDIDPLF